MEMKSFTAVDSVYEFFGYTMGERLYGTLAAIHLPAMLAIAGFCLVAYRASSSGHWGGVLGYVFWIVVALWLTRPVEFGVGVPLVGNPGDSATGKQTTVKAPRFLAYPHILTDNIVAVGVTNASAGFQTAAYKWVRLAAAAQNARILNDVALRQRFANFVTDCYMPALARYPKTDETVYPTDEPAAFVALYSGIEGHGADGKPQACAALREELAQAIEDHLEHSEHHARMIREFGADWDSVTFSKQADGTYASREGVGQGMTQSEFTTYYRRRLLWNETFNYNEFTETALLDKAIPPYRYSDSSQNASGYAADSEPEDDSWTSKLANFGKNLWNGVKGAASYVIRSIAGVSEWVDQQSSGPMMYYRTTLYAPYIYGLVLMLLLVAWPIPAIWSLWPGAHPEHPFNWGPMINYLKVFISVKLWPFFWSLLAAFNTSRQWLPGEGKDGQGDEMFHAFSAIAAMYALVPVISFMVVMLTSKAGQMAVGGFAGMGAPGAGGAGAMMQQGLNQAAQWGEKKMEKGLAWLRGLSGGGGGGGGGGATPPPPVPV